MPTGYDFTSWLTELHRKYVRLTSDTGALFEIKDGSAGGALVRGLVEGAALLVSQLVAALAQLLVDVLSQDALVVGEEVWRFRKLCLIMHDGR